MTEATGVGKALEEHLRMVDPDVVVSNKKNVSRLLSQAFLGADGYTGNGWPESTQDAVTLVYSTTAHMQMRLFSRTRLSEGVQQLYRQE